MDMELQFPTRDVEIRKACSKMLGLSKAASNKFTKEELLDICEKRGYITIEK